MKSISASLLLFSGLASAVDLFLWKNSNSCSGSGIVCVNIPENSCCRNGDLFGSGEARNPPAGMTSVTQLFSRQRGLDCGINFGPVKPIPVCLITNLDLSVSGIAWDFQNRRIKRDTMISPANSVVGDPAYKEGDTVYVISKDKLNTARLAVPENEAEQAAFFKTHATSTLKMDSNNSIEKVEQAAGGETSGEKSK